jgi:hypothetical protein
LKLHFYGTDVVEWSRALDIRLSDWCWNVSMVWIQIPSREEQKIWQLKNLILTLFGLIFRRIYIYILQTSTQKRQKLSKRAFEWKRICAGIFIVCLYNVYVYTVGEPIIKRRIWDPTNCSNPATFVCLSKTRNWISNIICRGLFLCSVI